jgi:hypothetical protein
MTIVKCDRCGNEVDPATKAGIPKQIDFPSIGKFDICEECFRKVKDFVLGRRKP